MEYNCRNLLKVQRSFILPYIDTGMGSQNREMIIRHRHRHRRCHLHHLHYLLAPLGSVPLDLSLVSFSCLLHLPLH